MSDQADRALRDIATLNNECIRLRKIWLEKADTAAQAKKNLDQATKRLSDLVERITEDFDLDGTARQPRLREADAPAAPVDKPVGVVLVAHLEARGLDVDLVELTALAAGAPARFEALQAWAMAPAGVPLPDGISVHVAGPVVHDAQMCQRCQQVLVDASNLPGGKNATREGWLPVGRGVGLDCPGPTTTEETRVTPLRGRTLGGARKQRANPETERAAQSAEARDRVTKGGRGDDDDRIH